MKIKINLIKEKDHYFLNRLYNENILKKKNFSTKLISLKDHLKWYETNKRKIIIFIGKLKKNIGYLRFNQKRKHWYISIAIKSDYQRKGLGSKILNISIKKFMRLVKKNDKNDKNDYKIIAEIKKNNIASINFFKKNNFNYYFSNKKKKCFIYNGK